MQANTFLSFGRRDRRHAAALAVLTLAMATNPALAQVSVSVAFDSSAGVLTATDRSNVTSHLQEAGRRWGSVVALSGPRSVEVTVSVGAIATASGASLTSSFIGSIGGRDTFEQGVAAEWRTGIDPNGAAADASVTFGLAYLRNELWFDPDPQLRSAPVPLDRTDAMSVLLHEFGHILAYNGFADVNTGQPPPTFWSIWDRWMIPGQPTLFSGPASVAAWGAAPELTIGNINHWGNPVPGIGAALTETCANTSPWWRDGAPVPRQCRAPGSVDAPASAPADPTPSIATGGNLLDQLMNGVVFFRGTRYDLSALDVAVLEDVGFTVERIFASGFDAP
jgi:hypothetical protein